MIPVIWYADQDGNGRGSWWDQALIEAVFDRSIWRPVKGFTFEHHEGIGDLSGDFAIIVLPARHLVGKEEQISQEMSGLKSVLVMVVGDEEASFNIDKVFHPRMIVYAMTPHPGKYKNIDRFLPNGFTPDTRKTMVNVERRFDYSFAGQTNHEARQRCIDAVQAISSRYKGKVIETEGFTQGISHEDYYQLLCSSKIALAPGGPKTPDTFRLYEALEAGAFPIVDDRPGREPMGYWKLLFGEVPFHAVEDWRDLPGLIEHFVDRYPEANNKTLAWWMNYKRGLVYQIEDDIAYLTKARTESKSVDELVTVLIPTSPILSHPDTWIIEETIKSVRNHLDCEILIMVDGVRKEQEDRRKDYDEYVRRLLWKANHEWHNVLPILFEEYKHQSGMTKEALKLVRTPTVLFVEHDTPLCEEIPFDGLTRAVMAGEANVIRLHHEALILDEHNHMMLDQKAQDVLGVPMVRTAQWSQRPHLASTEFYRNMIEQYFSENSKAFIEDRVHGQAHEAYRLRGKAGWNDWKLWIYAPSGDMKRSYHTDGRAGESKFDSEQVL